MKALLTVILGLALGGPVLAADLANGERLNQRCAPCHAQQGQGVPSAIAPRLAGLPAWYLEKATKDYLKGARDNPLMIDIAGLRDMSEQDISDLSAWLAGQPVAQDPAYDIRVTRGRQQAGKRKFEADCKNCHARDGYGKKKKDAPPLAGQHADYLFASMRAFFHKDRYHDNDPIDDTFDDISDSQAWNILAWLATLDDKKQRTGFHLKPRPLPTQIPARGRFQIHAVQHSLISARATPGTTPSQAIERMLTKARELGVPQLPKAPAEPLPLVVALKFCAPGHIDRLLKAQPLLANYDPCRVTLMQDDNGPPRLMMVNLDMLLDGRQLPPEAQRIAILINQDMLAILRAGVGTGEERKTPPDGTP